MFRSRAVLLVIELLLVASAISGCTAAVEQEVFRKVKEKGGKVELPGKGPEITFSNVKLTDDDLASIGKLPHVRQLTLEYVDITDKGLEHLLAIEQFDTLRIKRTKATEAGIAKLKQKFPQLNVLEQWGDRRNQ